MGRKPHLKHLKAHFIVRQTIYSMASERTEEEKLERRREQKRRWARDNKEKAKAATRRWREDNKERVAANNKKYRKTDTYKEYVREYNKREHVKAYRDEYNARPEVKEHRREYCRERNAKAEVKQRRNERNNKRMKCPTRRLRLNVSKSVYSALKRHETTKGGGATFDHLPYSPEQLAAYIEQRFTAEMNWDNYGTTWHLDHIIPQAALPYDSMEHPNFAKCWALENLQPLDALENIRKSSIHEGVKHSYGDSE